MPSMLGPIDPAHEVLHNPVRDDAMLSPTEDLDREPDGVPHRVVGFTALFSVILAILTAFMFLWGGTVTKIAAVLLVLLAIPAMVTRLGSKAQTERDRMHPSR